ncbi:MULTISPECIES: hypothetical protein [Pseudomonas]|jgi:TM2 domain-containing membrane protein YozV|uniref:Uncharacterized protein n=1 Tax=Pseudomonas frederiksbergensis TaxID=104087 RepID=A0A0B1YUR1_9PSED|nr:MULTISPECIES: hypothetical protein [Pseudomonas]KHK62554.1 hypothetical protein JZ00_22565 [Pseudomonas frederiksbergensis]MBI6621509.1 hypothetical protein [Pseudomonas corrugata]MBI6693431.1 hypothetical protein [Pseudomonas corrugata]
MSLNSQYVLAGLGILLLHVCVRRYVLRVRLGIALVCLGFLVIFVLPPFIGSIDVGLFAIAAIAAGSGMFSSRRMYEK